jgi:phage baseplate assembly protein W
MAIKISNLQKISQQFTVDEYLYKDLHLDFKKTNNVVNSLNLTIEKGDVETDFDKNAIKNSLRNLFNTKPGERFLFPNYGLSLHQFVFEPIAESTAQLIGERIVKAIETYENRVLVRQCYIKAKPDDNEYEITLVLEFPVFNTVATLNSTLDIQTQSFIFAETSKNR